MSPRFSIVTPVYDPPEDILWATIRSVLDQTFGDFELILVDDASPSPHVAEVLQAAAALDPRVRVATRDVNGGIVAASNDALALAEGELVALLDHDDLLARHALASMAAAFDAHPDTDYAYSDEDHLTPDGLSANPFYKPDWSPARLRSQNYCCHLSVLRRSLVEEVGGFREGFDGSQDYDLILRVTERARHVHHVPGILYHWRQLPTSVAGDPNAKPYAYEAGRRAIQEHCDRIGLDATVEEQVPLGTYRVRRRLKGQPLVSVIIPTRGTSGRVWGVERYHVVEAVRSLVETSTYQNLELVVVVDEPTPPVVIRALEEIAGDRLRLVWYRKKFNFSEKINIGRVESSGELLLLLNDDVELITPDAIEIMAAIAQEDDVGSVGAKLYFSDGTLQHAGHVYTGDPFHAFFRWSGDHPGPLALLKVEREVVGSTAACLMMRADVFDDVGGLTSLFEANFNDVDLALKLLTLGYRNVWSPHAELYHFESVTRDPTVTREEYLLMRSRWSHELDHDPYYNINLEPKRNDWVERGIR